MVVKEHESVDLERQEREPILEKSKEGMEPSLITCNYDIYACCPVIRL